jgi:hypothetical protein
MGQVELTRKERSTVTGRKFWNLARERPGG